MSRNVYEEKNDNSANHKILEVVNELFIDGGIRRPLQYDLAFKVRALAVILLL